MADRFLLEVPYLLSTFQNTRYVCVAAITLILYDHIVTLDAELDLIWSKSWSFVKILFISHRYFGLLCVIIEIFAFFGQVSDRFCTFWFGWEFMGFSAAILTSQIVLFLWIYVMYDGNKAVTGILALLFVACATATYVMLCISFQGLQIIGEIIPDKPFCSVLNPPPLLVYFFTPILVYSAAVLLLIAFKGYQLLSSPRARARNAALTDVYLKSTINFVIMFSSYLLCTIFWLAAKFALAQVPMVLALSLSITNASNLLLHIRYAYYSPRSLEQEAHSISSLTGSKTIYVDSRSGGSAEWMYELRELKWKRR